VLKLLVSLDDRRLLACTCAAHDAAKDRLAAPGARGMTFRPIVLEGDPGRRLRWRGHLLLAGLFDGEHSFTIQPSATVGSASSSRRSSRDPCAACARSLDVGEEAARSALG